MKKSRFVSIICAASMAAASLTGCAGNAPAGVIDETAEASETTEAATVSSYVSKYRLSNPNADEVTRKVYDYICENFGEKIISAQQESTWKGSPDYEMDIIKAATGKLPAMRGLDYMNADFQGVNQRAIKWWEQGGLVTICWHTGINGFGYNESKDDVPDFEKLFTE